MAKYLAWTKEADEELIRRYERGERHQDIAIALRRPISHISTRVWFLRKNGVALTPRRGKAAAGYYAKLNATIQPS